MKYIWATLEGKSYNSGKTNMTKEQFKALLKKKVKLVRFERAK